MLKRILNIVPICLFLYSFACTGQVLRKRTTLLMGSRFDITIVAEDSLTAETLIKETIAEIIRIENLISDWKSDSQVSEVNQNAGIRAVKVDPEVFDLTKRAIAISKITNGAFDISFAALEKVWKYDGSMTKIPTPEQIKKSVEKVGYQNIVLDSIQSTIFLKLPGMKIGFGSIGKGYAADKAREVMEAKGVKAGIVNASGDLTTWGKQPNGKEWTIGITNPFDTDKFVKIFSLKREAVTTSGNYEKFVELNGKRYSHIINPITGYPATGLVSVTVFGPSAEMANGFSTSLIVLGKEAGLQLIHKYPEYSCLMITDKGKVFKSKNFRRN
ncbi:FAD:protein FMN transferase [Flavobacterium sp. LC2016-23]|uniref:FAD:protein FMN transferase n=1 Tax=Flavobacterium sp. LC2016-23 TaxID=2666330 RepID=UPI0012B0C55F|nr:FAD:protein FMN transferase [Flavobacterium sp. LC2016-23]MRX39041.1 FAD:protein FMN transferase [Flavobacterium sp. LC2016-23]